ncbi:putative type III restriction-modification system, methylase subunit M [Candidatus Saccharimonas aalborgensis]|uniref:Putative type III restriction-modification system, methylase subunit M n=1 Tax=Candidatus Saccharimonas aalborgensis TaxID=1332188 RepID=R4PUL3_9BACT|nr:site-specific DNA-methyltransferase [Candidatus Saccharimonas aalborgensis]AGL61835.1 putative type III restriction-modification system, methylase subunit M [Candidatus Saccharimonas aalborgensis]
MTNLTNILAKLTALIEKNKAYIIDGSLNRNLLAADARKYDPELLNLLQKDAELKEHFFAATDGGLVFKKDVFLQFIMNKEFLPDSYTKYKIKIGLGADDGSLLSESGDVVLNWPYKDAILEGGQDKEDQKRSEVFFNEVLAPDQITRLFDDKVFTNWKRYDKDGERDLDELKDDDNLIIKGNNLVVLHSLKKRYAGRVKMIYIDPPYNTGNDSFGYNDRFNHASWLTFMRNRLNAAKMLLANDSVLAIQIDDDEHAYLKVLADEILGRDNFVKSIALKMSTASGVKTAHRDRTILKEKEHILIYKRGTLRVTPEYIKADEWDSEFQFVLEGKESGKYKVIKLSEYLKQNNIDANANSDEFKEFVIKNADIIWRRAFIRGSWKEKSLANPSEVIVNKGENGIAYYYGGRQMYFYKEKFHEFYDENTKKFGPSSLLGDLWADINTGRIFNEGGVELRNGKKAEQILARLLRMFTKPGDLVMDYHLGSGTTSAVAHKMGRQYIGIEQLYYGDNDPMNRLQNVINGDQSGISKGVNWQGGGSFVYANIMNNSNKFRKRVEAAMNDSDYLALLKEATSSSFLSYRVDPKKLNEEEFRKLSSAEKRRLLLELIDNNTLYVNYEDINDPLFKVSEKDKEFNKKLYEKN